MGVETIPESDGPLAQRLAEWKKITSNKFILQSIQGYRIPFKSKPPLIRDPHKFAFSLPPSSAKIIDEEVDSLLNTKDAIEIAPRDAGFFSRMFTVPKKGTTELRPVLNVKRLNKFINTPKFRMPTVKQVRNMLQPMDYLLKIDMRHAFYHVPIWIKHRKFLRFTWRGTTYQFKRLPFGLSTSPKTFASVTKPLVYQCKINGVRLVLYLDDMLLAVYSKRAAKWTIKFVKSLMKRLGFQLNLRKSMLIPCRQLEYIGLWWNTEKMEISLPQDKLQAIHQSARDLLHHPCPTVRKTMRFLGQLNFANYGHRLARRKTRAIQQCVLESYHSTRDLFKPIHLSLQARAQLKFWTTASQCPVPIKQDFPSVVLATDSSDEHWGMHLQGQGVTPTSFSASWPQKWLSNHINWKEMKAVQLALIRADLHDCTIALQLDNLTAKSYLLNQGGTRSVDLSKLACCILSWAERRNLTLVPVFVPTHIHSEADS